MSKEDLQMPKIAEYLNIGNREDMTVEDLLLIVEKMYIDIATALNRKPDIIQQTTDGSSSATFLSNGDIHINTNTNKVEMLTNHTSSTAVTWTTLS